VEAILTSRPPGVNELAAFHQHQNAVVCSKLTRDSVRTGGMIETMRKKRTKKQSAKATLAEVIKEMAKPRVASSARD
jgi:hypothetical protein